MPLFRTFQVYFQFTLPPWGAVKDIPLWQTTAEFSILAPRMGSDRVNQYALVKLHFIFQFSLPAWGATNESFSCFLFCFFNSRSPLGERHRSNYYCDIIDNLFNSHSPHGERHNHEIVPEEEMGFQFTLPVWGAIMPHN